MDDIDWENKSNETENLPESPYNQVTLGDLTSYELEPFLPVEESSDDITTTTSDLALLNNHLAMCSTILPSVRTLAGLSLLSNTVCKLIETRRKVKKLQYGSSKNALSVPFQILE